MAGNMKMRNLVKYNDKIQVGMKGRIREKSCEENCKDMRRTKNKLNSVSSQKRRIPHSVRSPT